MKSKYFLTTLRPRASSIAVSAALAALSGASAMAQTAPADDALPEVTVKAAKDTAYRAQENSAGALGDKALLDTPFSVEVVTQDLIRNRQATTIDQVFKGDASVTAVNNGYIGEASGISIRGLQLDLLNGFKIDGLAVPNWGSDVPVEHFERIELLKGSAGFMYGFGTPGGIANFVLKRPTAQPTASVTLGYASGGTLTEQVDLGGRFGADKQVGYRFDLVHEEGDTFIDDGHINRTSVLGAVDVRLTDRVTWQADVLHQDRKVNGAYYGVIPWQDYYPGVSPALMSMVLSGTPLGAPPFPVETINGLPTVDGSKRLAQPYTWYATELLVLGTAVNWSIAPDWDARFSYRWSQQDRNNADSAIFLLNNSGGYMELQWLGDSRYEYQNADVMVTGKVQTGLLRHELVFGASWQLQETMYGGFGSAYLGYGSNFQQASLFPNPGVSASGDLYRSEKTTQKSLYVSDTVQFHPQWSALFGLRYTKFDQAAFNDTGATTSSDDRTPTTPTVALLFKPWAGATAYASYVESLEQGGAAGPFGTPANSQHLPPLISRQSEFGFKLDQKDWSANAALFRLNRGLEDNYEQKGTERYLGFELGAKALLARHWTLGGSLLWLDAENRSDDATLDGKRPAGAPEFQAAAYVEYALPSVPGLTLTGGANYFSDRPLEANNSNLADAYATLDLGARYKTRVGGRDLTLRLNVDNVTNEEYWQTSWGFILVQGAPRTVKASAQLSF